MTVKIAIPCAQQPSDPTLGHQSGAINHLIHRSFFQTQHGSIPRATSDASSTQRKIAHMLTQAEGVNSRVILNIGPVKESCLAAQDLELLNLSANTLEIGSQTRHRGAQALHGPCFLVHRQKTFLPLRFTPLRISWGSFDFDTLSRRGMGSRNQAARNVSLFIFHS